MTENKNLPKPAVRLSYELERLAGMAQDLEEKADKRAGDERDAYNMGVEDAANLCLVFNYAECVKLIREKLIRGKP